MAIISYVFDGKILQSDYAIYCIERAGRGGGGVQVTVSNHISSTHIDTLALNRPQTNSYTVYEFPQLACSHTE